MCTSAAYSYFEILPYVFTYIFCFPPCARTLMMANPNASTSIVSSESSEEKATHIADLNMNMLELSLSHQSLITSYDPVSIFWDIENCCIPTNVPAEAVVVNIRKALWTNPLIKELS
jgi:hypothetical protein